MDLSLKSFWTAGLSLVISTMSFGQIFIQAEDYSTMSGVQLEGCSDDGKGLNLGWIDTGDWMEYSLNVPVAGDYVFDFRVASLNGGGNVSVVNSSGTSLGAMNITATGGWQIWQTISCAPISLNQGTQTIRLQAASGGFNLNWFEFKLTNPNDSDVPSVPLVLDTVTDVHKIRLVWNASSDTTTIVTGYKIYNNSKFLAFTTDTVLVLDKLPPNTNLSLQVKACDLAGNQASSSVLPISTRSIPWAISWADEFNGTQVDTSKWNFQVGGSGWGNGEAQYYTNGTNASVQNGHLVIEARQQTVGSNQYTSSRMNTSNKGDFLYGRIEIRAKLPSTGGTWPAIWTLPTNWSYGNWPDCGEIDIMEHRGNYLNYVFGTIHTGAYNHLYGTDQSGGKFFTDVVNTFHTYTLEWYPDHLDWYYDDEIIFTFENEYKTFSEWPYDIPHHLLLNIAVGGSLGGTINHSGVWPQQMVVDFVRVYDFDLGANDSIPPTDPSNLQANVSGVTVDLSWDLSTDNEYVERYYIYQDSVLIDSVSGSETTLKYLQPLTQYTFGVQAKDFGGNLSSIVSTVATTGDLNEIAIPGVFEAEDYIYMNGMQTESCQDVGGGLNMGYIDEGDWLEYYIDVATAGTYYLTTRSAAAWKNGNFEVLDEAGSTLVTVFTPNTGGWQIWENSVSGGFYLDVGIQLIKIRSLTNEYNLNSFAITANSSGHAFSVEDEFIIEESIYPNPFDGHSLTIEMNTPQDYLFITIHSIDGKEVFSKEYSHVVGALVIDELNLSKGEYLLSVNFAKQTRVVKLMVE